MKFKGDSLHRQGTSSKRDLIGGYIERWFNKAAETIIFNQLLENKKYRVISDYFIYNNESEKNAPDILGLKKDNEIIPFSLYDNGSWARAGDMPKIEVKVVRKDQMLLGVREPQMHDDYYAFIESDLEGDYLTAIFEDSVFDDKYFMDLKMSEKFIKKDTNNQIIPQEKVKKTNRIGSMRLIGIYKKDELKKHSTLCGKKISPYYFGGAENKESRSPNCNEELKLDDRKRFVYRFDDSYIALPISIENPNNTPIMIKKKNKGSVYIHASSGLNINGVDVGKGDIVINYKRFDRSSNWEENIVSKHILELYGNDATKDLISLFDEIATNYQPLV